METAAGQLLHHLHAALHVDVQQQVAAVGLGMAQRRDGGAVVVAEDLGPLQELSCGDHLLELLAAW